MKKLKEWQRYVFAVVILHFLPLSRSSKGTFRKVQDVYTNKENRS